MISDEPYLHVDPEWVSIFAVNVYWAEHVELDVVFGHEIFNFVDFLELLIELVTRESQDTQTVSFRVLKSVIDNSNQNFGKSNQKNIRMMKPSKCIIRR